MYILTETKDNGDQKEYSFQTFEEAQTMLNEKAEADKASQTESCEIIHSADTYSRVSQGTNRYYHLKIEAVNEPKPFFESISF